MMPPSNERRPRPVEVEGAEMMHFDDTPAQYPVASSGGPTWYLIARPLTACHDHDEYAIDCPADCGREAIAWRSRPGERAGGWGCACGARGALWQLLPGVVA